MREFLNEENRGLDVLIDYLSFRLLMMKYELKTTSEEMGNDWATVKERLADGANNATKSIDRLGKIELSSPRMKRANKHVTKLKVPSSFIN